MYHALLHDSRFNLSLNHDSAAHNPPPIYIPNVHDSATYIQTRTSE